MDYTNFLIKSLIFYLGNAVTIAFALIVFLRLLNHFVPMADWKTLHKNSLASAIVMGTSVIAFMVLTNASF